MYLRTLELEEFRSYRRLKCELPSSGLRVVGPNASGKSTLLEAIDLLSTTRSSRSSVEREVINWESGVEFGVPPFARVRGVVVRDGTETQIEVALQQDANRPGSVRKQIKLDNRPVRALDVVGRLAAVQFVPEDVALISGPPSARRRYLDRMVSQVDRRYLRSLSAYARVLEQRNSLLKSLQKGRGVVGVGERTHQLAFWDSELVRHGAVIIAARSHNVEKLAGWARRRYDALSANVDFEVDYQPSVSQAGAGVECGVPVDEAEAVTARGFAQALADVQPEELRRGVSLLGPHRDDLRIVVDERDVAAYGSRGQHRLAVVALKLGEIDVMTEALGEAPVLLLDDVLSELDADHRSHLLMVSRATQAQLFVTGTDLARLEGMELAGIPTVAAGGGTLDRLPDDVDAATEG